MRTHLVRASALAGAGVALLTACCSRTQDDPLGDAGLVAGTSWHLVTFVVDGEEVVPVEDAPVTLERWDDSVGGSTGCNRYRGDLVAPDHEGVLLPPLAMTRKLCADPDIQRVESLYVAALAEVTDVHAAEDLLILSSGTATLIYTAALVP